MTSSVIGETKTGQRVAIFRLSRLLGLYVIGMQRMGKSGLFEELIIQDIKQGIGVCVLDPHGELIDHVIARLRNKAEEEKVVLLDITSKDYYAGLNLLDCADPTDDSAIMETLSQVMHVFEKAFGITQLTPLLYDLLFKIAYVLIANPGYTMVDIPFFLTNEICRKKLVQNVAHPAAATIRAFWERWDDPKQKSSLKQQEDSQTILNKLNDFEHDPLRYIVGQSHSTINLQEIMDSGKILLVKLERKRTQATSLIGSILVALILNASEDRKTNKLFNLYADEFQNFATEDFAVLLEQSPKRGIGVTMAHQNRGQLELSEMQADANLKQRTLSVGNLIAFRVPTDAHEIAGNFDCTPIRTKKVLKQRTEPVYKEWDEYYWDSDEAEQQFHEFDHRSKDAWQQVQQAIIRAMCAQALSDHFRDAFSSKKWHDTPNYDGLSFDRLISLSNEDEGWYKEHKAEINYYLHHPLNPAWMPFQGNGKAPLSETAEVERNLVLCDLRSETIRDHFYYWPDWWNGKPFYKKYRKRVDYTYLKREEWYSFSGEAAISGVEYALQHGSWPSVITKEFPHWKGTTYSGLIPMKQEVDTLFRNLLDALITEVHEFVAPFYARLRLKFVPNLAPEMPWDRAKRDDPYCSDGWSPPEDGEVRFPRLADEPQPEIGQRRVGVGWTREGQWSTWKFEGAESWLIKIEKRLEEQVKHSEKEVVVCENRWQQLLNEQQEFKGQHYKTAHRREYLGEQPVKEQQVDYRFSRVTDTQWYDFTEEQDQTYDQRRDEITNELVKLPKYTARVKLTDENDAVVEYVIATMKPGTGLYGKPLQERIDGVRDRNMRDGYLRKRAAVEEEIRQRQEQCFHTPQMPGKQTPQPPEDEPPISRRPPR